MEQEYIAFEEVDTEELNSLAKIGAAIVKGATMVPVPVVIFIT